MSGENEIQSACMDSLAIYFREKRVQYRQLWTYSNQQGNEANKFCGDLIGVIDDATMFALEMKALDHTTGCLAAFDEDQFTEAKEMEENGIPIFYCYDHLSPLAYYANPKPSDWPTRTLSGLNLSRPKNLDCKRPKQECHKSLLCWLDHQSSGTTASPLAKFAELVGQVLPNKMRNGLVTLLYSENNREALALNHESLQIFYTYLLANPGEPGSVLSQRIQELLAGVDIGNRRATNPKSTKSIKKQHRL